MLAGRCAQLCGGDAAGRAAMQQQGRHDSSKGGTTVAEAVAT